MKILIIEDDAALRTVYREVLEHGGHQVIQAATPQAARDLCQTSRFNVVLSDAMFDTHDTEQMFTLWQTLQTGGSRVIVISGESSLRQQVEAAGMLFILKPMSVLDLINLVDQT